MDEDDKNIEEMSKEEKDRIFKNEAVPHRESLLRYAQKKCNSKANAEELVQDTMLRAYRFFDKYEPDTNCQAWLYTILNNLYNNKYKRYKRQPDQVHFDDTEELFNKTSDRSEVSINENKENKFISNILSEEILNTVRRLSRNFRITFILIDIQDFSYQEASDMLECPLGTIMSRLHRARNLLKNMLHDYAEEKGFFDQDSKEQIRWY